MAAGGGESYQKPSLRQAFGFLDGHPSVVPRSGRFVISNCFQSGVASGGWPPFDENFQAGVPFTDIALINSFLPATGCVHLPAYVAAGPERLGAARVDAAKKV
jgi:hypothetical protein